MSTGVRITAETGVPHQDMGSVSIVSTATLQRDMFLAVYADLSQPGQIILGDRPQPA